MASIFFSPTHISHTRLILHAAWLILFMQAIPIRAQLAITATTDPTTLTNAISGPGATLTNLTANQGTDTSQVGTFTGGDTPSGPGPTIGLASGVLLVGGTVTSAGGANTLAGSSSGSATDTFTDPDLGLLTGRTGDCASGDQCDVVVLEFDVVGIGRNIEIDFVFAAEEYPEYVCSQFNDAVGIFISGPGLSGPYSNGAINLADLPSTSLVAVNNINGGISGSQADGTACSLTNTAAYVYNTVVDDTGTPDPANFTNTQFDGFTIPMTAKVTVTPGATYRVRIALSDIGDSSWDTGMFIGEIRGGGIDYGDAPDSYSTEVSNPNGVTLGGAARHSILSGLALGTSVDGDNNGLPGPGADGDDTDVDNPSDGDDEDSITAFPVGFSGNTYTVTTHATNTTATDAFIVGYIDFTGDGDFNDPGEQSTPTTVPSGSNNLPFPVVFTVDPATATTSSTYARFRLSSNLASIQSHSGPAPDGEVEDYPIPAGFLPVVLAAFQANSSQGNLNFSWSTTTETFNAGFYLYHELAGKRLRLQNRLIPSKAANTLSPNTYATTLKSNATGPFWLSEVDIRGKEAFFGPFQLSQLYGRLPNPTPVPWSDIRQEQSRLLARWYAENNGRDDGKPIQSLALRVGKTGFQKVDFQQILASGVDLDGIPLADLAVSTEGRPVPRQILSKDNRFGPGDTLIFWGETRSNDLYSDTQNYLISINRRLAMPVLASRFASPGKEATSYQASFRFEEENHYSFSAPNGDPWFAEAWLSYGAPFQTTHTFPLDNLAREGGVATLRLDYWGVTNWPEDSPDHHVIFKLNGVVLGEDIFDGLQARTQQFVLAPEWIQEEENTLEIHVPGDTGFDFDLIHLDRFELRYPRRFSAPSGQLNFASSAGQFTVRDLPSDQLVIWARTATASYALTYDVQGDKQGFQASFKGVATPNGTKEPTYHVATLDQMNQPSLFPAPTLHPELFQGHAQLLLISHPSFIPHLGEFVEAKEALGIRTKIVNVFDIYAHLNHGHVHPKAIHEYLIQAYEKLRIEAVLLVGGDTYDYKDRLGLGSVSFIPSPYTKTHELVSFSPVDPLFGDLNGDRIPEIPIGRFPVRQLTELQWLVEKSLKMKNENLRAIFAADDAPNDFFKATSRDLASKLPKNWESSGIYLDDQPVEEAHPRLMQALNLGPALVNFIGHSAPTAWTFDGLFDDDDASDLTNTDPLLVLQWGCWNTYHVEPAYDTMGHRLLLSGRHGAGAVIGSATLTLEASDHALGVRLFERLFIPGMTLGQAMIQAKRALANSMPNAEDVILGWTLLGDPTLTLESSQISRETP